MSKKTYKIRYSDQTMHDVEGKPLVIPGCESYTFFTYKNEFGKMIITNIETGYQVCTLETLDKLKPEWLNEIIAKTLVTELNPEWQAKKKEAGDKLTHDFLIIFKTPITWFYNPMFGFDAVRFDEKLIKPNENESTFQAIERKYGAIAAKLIEDLFSFEKEYGNLYR